MSGGKNGLLMGSIVQFLHNYFHCIFLVFVLYMIFLMIAFEANYFIRFDREDRLRVSQIPLTRRGERVRSYHCHVQKLSKAPSYSESKRKCHRGHSGAPDVAPPTLSPCSLGSTHTALHVTSTYSDPSVPWNSPGYRLCLISNYLLNHHLPD